MKKQKIRGLLNIEIVNLLEEASNADFLDSILILKEKEKMYQASEFYKKVRIDLATLYKFYVEKTGAKRNLDQTIEDIIANINPDLVVEKLESILTRIEDSELLMNKIRGFSEKLNLEELLKEGDRFEEIAKDLKK